MKNSEFRIGKEKTKEQGFAIGIDLGGTKIEASVIRNDGKILRTERKTITRSFDGLKNDFHEIISKIRGSEQLIGIGCGIPGSIDPKTRLLRNAPNNPEIMGTNFFDVLAKEFDLPVRYDNDANCLVRSEHLFGVLKGYQNAVGIILGSGVGGGVLLNGRVFHSSRGLAPELGHTIINVNGRPCLCGNKGCIEAYLSGPAILGRYHEASGDRSVTQTKEVFDRANTPVCHPDPPFGGEGSPGHKGILRSAQNDKQGSDPIARAIITETKEIFSRFVASLVSIYDPEVVVLGGGLAKQKIFYECQELIGRYIFGSNEAPPVVFAQHGDASGKLGAAAMFFS